MLCATDRCGWGEAPSEAEQLAGVLQIPKLARASTAAWGVSGKSCHLSRLWDQMPPLILPVWPYADLPEEVLLDPGPGHLVKVDLSSTATAWLVCSDLR